MQSTNKASDRAAGTDELLQVITGCLFGIDYARMFNLLFMALLLYR
jgi:hypothetical protein